ncbi:MAG: aminotransferase class V-fold PLP-dependent enzyme [Clostridia bacterium]|nr:aminotransferase class V-fold PLP-dependent enzyme [Clostridia bacterium]
MMQLYFDNGASSYPKPRNVYENTFDYIYSNGANSGRSSHQLAIEAAEMVYETRNALSRFFNMQFAENVVFTLNATYALNTVLQGFLKPWDHEITTVLEHNSVLRPLYELKRCGVTLDIVDVDLYDDAGTVENIANKINHKTRAIVISQCSNVCGKIMPIREISKLKSQRIRLIVDGSQGAGSIPTDFENDGIDYYCAPFHKGMLGLQGGGFALCRYNELKPLIYGGTGSESARKEQPEYLPERLEAGTLPMPSIFSLREGIGFLNSVGVGNVFAHKKNLVKQLYRELRKNPKVQLNINYDKMPSPGVFAFNIIDVNSEEIAEKLGKCGVAVRAGLHCAPLFHQKMGTFEQGMVRVSLGYANTEQEIDKFVKIIEKI